MKKILRKAFVMTNNGKISRLVDPFLDQIEQDVIHFTKAVQVDCEILKYRPSLILCSLISVTIEILLHEELARAT